MKKFKYLIPIILRTIKFRVKVWWHKNFKKDI